MATLKILRMGHPVLREKAKLVSLEELRSPEFQQLIQDMFATMEAYEGIGLAAPQIGISKQLAIVGIPEDNPRYPDAPETEQYVIINPIIKILDTKLQGFWEGCLSIPGLRGHVERPRKLQVDYMTLEGSTERIVVEGFVATVFQHELDHLEGKLYIDRIKDTRKLAFNEEYDSFLCPDRDKDDKNKEID
ncbi:MAG: peptide deformylase [Bdellovibrionales bacterium GWA2_49_15]|nr:MAG: peptide deformylase [Bdellovibrionales bacterium GWA2_49_15]HAZ12105.1 peptide deformylase [Bdellovibrionales bacterium]